MIFKRSGNKIQVLSYRGYDREKKRSIFRMVGSISGTHFTPTDRYQDSITDDEKKEIQAYIESVHQKDVKESASNIFKDMPDILSICLTAIRDKDTTVSKEWSANVWKGIDEIGRELRKRGFGKHTVLRTKKEGA